MQEKAGTFAASFSLRVSCVGVWIKDGGTTPLGKESEA